MCSSHKSLLATAKSTSWEQTQLKQRRSNSRSRRSTDKKKKGDWRREGETGGGGGNRSGCPSGSGSSGRLLAKVARQNLHTVQARRGPTGWGRRGWRGKTMPFSQDSSWLWALLHLSKAKGKGKVKATHDDDDDATKSGRTSKKNHIRQGHSKRETDSDREREVSRERKELRICSVSQVQHNVMLPHGHNCCALLSLSLSHVSLSRCADSVIFSRSHTWTLCGLVAATRSIDLLRATAAACGKP